MKTPNSPGQRHTLSPCYAPPIRDNEMKAEFTADEKMVVMISGANRGIGEEIEKKLIPEGYILSLGARKIEALQNKSSAFDRDTVSCNWYDAEAPESATKWIDATIEQYGRIDILINNAGALPFFAQPEMGSVRFRVQTMGRRPLLRWPAFVPARTPRGTRTPAMT